MDREKLEQAAAAAQELLRRREENKLAYYRPYPIQRQFHTAGATYRERLLRAGNQNGKTYAGGMEAAFHLTGLYPDWWEGKKWFRPIKCWISGQTGETTRDNPQRALFGLPGEFGTGAIPRNAIGQKRSAIGVADLLDYARIRHVSGGWSLVRCKYYAQGWLKWAGPPIDFIWYDEEPEEDIYAEGQARLVATEGISMLTCTPLLGMSKVMRKFIMDTSGARSDTNMVIEDAEHIAPERRQDVINSFPEHEREARSRGIPTMGSGSIFPVPESQISWDYEALPDHFVWIGGIDFGWEHPTAAVKCAWDRENDVFYVVSAYKKKEEIPLVHSAALKPWGTWLRWGWPADGLQTEKRSGKTLKDAYKEHGLHMLFEHATHPDGGNSVEAGISQILEAMKIGKFKVAAHLGVWFEEFRLYHRKDGKIVKEYDDLLDATRYAWMMRRFATIEDPDRLYDNDRESSMNDFRGDGWMR